jgi:YaaC-like Protein
LLSMMNFASKDFMNEFLQHFPEQKVYPCQYDELLTEYSLLFVASNIARYRPQLWEKILAGSSENEAKFNNKIKTIYQKISGGESIQSHLTFKYRIWAEFSMILNQERARS